MPVLIDPNGFVCFAKHRWRCALGRGGLRQDKREGDGATPVGTFGLGRVFFRPDKCVKPPQSDLECIEITSSMGWCDDPLHVDYNCLITLPHPAHHERLWRDDDLYDVVVEVLHNTNPVHPGRGSAIFIHIAKPNYEPTEGCIALKKQHLLDLLRKINKNDGLFIPAVDAH